MLSGNLIACTNRHTQHTLICLQGINLRRPSRSTGQLAMLIRHHITIYIAMALRD